MTNQDYLNRPSAKITPRTVVACLIIGLAAAVIIGFLEAFGIDVSGMLAPEIGSL